MGKRKLWEEADLPTSSNHLQSLFPSWHYLAVWHFGRSCRQPDFSVHLRNPEYHPGLFDLYLSHHRFCGSSQGMVKHSKQYSSQTDHKPQLHVHRENRHSKIWSITQTSKWFRQISVIGGGRRSFRHTKSLEWVNKICGWTDLQRCSSVHLRNNRAFCNGQSRDSPKTSWRKRWSWNEINTSFKPCIHKRSGQRESLDVVLVRRQTSWSKTYFVSSTLE